MILSRIAWRILLFLSAPLILPEAVYARWRTPRLPEAKEPTEGRSPSALFPPLKLAFIGESTIAGVGAETMEKALTGTTIKHLESNYCIKWSIVGHNGIKIAELMPYLTPETLADKQIIVVAIGANDTTKFTRYSQWVAHVKIFIDQVKSVTDAPIIFNQLPPMHLFTALPQPLRSVVGMRAKMLDKALQKMCRKTDNCHYLPLDFQPKVEFLASDGYHPSEVGYQKWGQMLGGFIHELKQKK